MVFSRQQADPRRHMLGLALVIVLHVAVIHALVTGLAKKVVDIVRAPIDTRVVEEVRKPPPPPELVVPPPPRLDAPPPPFIAPPEIQMQAPPQQPPTITATSTPPPEAVAIAPMAPAVPAEKPAAPAPLSAGIVCANYASVMGALAYPREAMRQGIERGDATLLFTVDALGAVKDIRVESASHPIFARAGARIVADYRCQGQGRDVLVRVPFGFRLE
jgi:protein TonB